MNFSPLLRLLIFVTALAMTTVVGAQTEVDRATAIPGEQPTTELEADTNDSSDIDTEVEADSPPIQLALNFDPGKLLEEVRVTGTYIKGIQQEDLPTPLNTLDREELKNVGAFKLADVINNLTINTGSENNADAFTQNFTTGTSNINLRGLGVASTLVLLNSRRQTYSAFTTNKGENFVDTASLVPMIAIDRVEILKDGSASLYGSDAVGGVVNFFTRNDFEGIEVGLDYLSGAHGQQDSTVSAIFGAGNDKMHFMSALSVFNRAGLSTADRRLSAPEDDLSDVGFPGSFLVPQLPVGADPVITQGTWTFAFDNFIEGATPTTPPTPGQDGIADALQNVVPFLPPDVAALIQLPILADPNCAAVASNDTTTVPPSTFPAGLCQFEFGDFFSVVPEEERLQFYGSYDINFSDSLRLETEIALANNDAERRNSPSFPIASLPGVPSYHPNNPFGVDVAFIGRTQGSGSAPLITKYNSDTVRAMAALEGKMGQTWTWTVDVSVSSNEFVLDAEDTLAAQFQLALAGLGGSGCSGNPADIGNPAAGCFFFNPFAAAPPASANANSVEMIDFVTGDFRQQAEAELTTYGGLFSGDVFSLPGGAAGLALGVQIRDESLKYDYDDNANSNNYLFFVGNPDFDTSRDATALFSELSMPFNDAFIMQLSVRSEDYGEGVDSTDPKLAVLWKPVENLAFRASVGTSFRAPSLFQSNGIQTSLEEVSTLAGTQFLPVQSESNPADPLQPEQADVRNVGFTWTPNDSQTRLSLDYWDFDYDQVIIQQNAQAVYNAAITGDTQALSQIEFSGTVLTPLSNIERIHTFYDNASSLQTNGIDLSFSQRWDTDTLGSFIFALNLTKVMAYDLEDPQAGAIDGLGSRNFTNFGTSMPEMRSVVQLGWNTQSHNVNLYARSIDGYTDDQNNADINSITTFDLQYRYTFAPVGSMENGISLAVGGINITDEDPPYVATNGGFDSKVHDPRGALYYVNMSFPF